MIGGIEAGRWYSLLLEVRLPPGQTAVGVARTSWIARDERAGQQAELIAVREEVAATSVPEVRRALDIVQILRAGDDSAAQLASYKARRELAVLEKRDPELIAALDKMIGSLTNPGAEANVQEGEPVEAHRTVGARVQRSALDRWTALIRQRTAHESLIERERLLLDADTSSCELIVRSPGQREFPEVQVMYDLMGALADSIEAGSSIHETFETGPARDTAAHNGTGRCPEGGSTPLPARPDDGGAEIPIDRAQGAARRGR